MPHLPFTMGVSSVVAQQPTFNKHELRSECATAPHPLEHHFSGGTDMARRNLEAGSSTSLLVSMQTDLIPKEYHRKVLKKIAQLTKVIYVLNTKNDEHESLVAKLKTTHKAELDRVLADSAQKLRDCKRKLMADNEASELKVGVLNDQLTLVQEEKDKLLNEQVSYKQAVEEKIAEAKSQYSDKVATITLELKRLQNQQEEQLKEVSQLQAKWSTQLQQKSEDIDKRHEKEMAKLKEEFQLKSVKDMTIVKDQHQRELEILKSELESALRKQQSQMSSTHQIMMEKKARETEGLLQKQLAKQEELLTNQIAALTRDLRKAQDSLAVSEQRITELVSQSEKDAVQRSDLQAQLGAAGDNVGDLESQLRQLKNEFEILQDLYEKQKNEMDKMATTIGQCHAQQVIDEGTIQKLQHQISKLEGIIKDLEKDNKIMQSSQLSTSEQLSAQIFSLEKELDKSKIEKKELKLQYAREIEAAQAQLGDRESQLIMDHTEAMQKLRTENQQAMEKARTRHREALEELKRLMQEERENALFDLEEKWKNDNNLLTTSLADHLMELNLVREELNRLKAELTSREKGFGSVSDSLGQVKEELTRVKRNLASANRDKDHLDKENHSLNTSLESMKAKAKKDAKLHQDQLNKLQRSLTEELEDFWKNKLKKECGLLMKELSSRHEEDSRAALLQLASLKDKAMEHAMGEWEAAKRQLLEKISSLEHLLEAAKQSNSSALDKAKDNAEKQLSDLRLELEEKSQQYKDSIQLLKQSHAGAVESLRRELDSSRETAITDLREKHRAEMEEQFQANQVTVGTLQDKMSRDSEEAMQESTQRHLMEMSLLRKQYLAEKDEALNRMSEENKREMEKLQETVEENITALRDEMLEKQATISDLNSEKEMRDKELNKLRIRINTMTANADMLQKQLDYKSQEIMMIKREMNAKIQQHGRELRAAHQAEQESLKSQYKHMTQKLLEDFNGAKTLFNRKIKQLEREVADWEQKYKCRDSRPEDLDQIRELKLATEQQRMKIKDLIAEKRVYQLELVNREKNYNQIFNASPSVGILNPLAHKQKKLAPGPLGTQYQSAPSLISNGVNQPAPPLFPPPLLSNHSLPELPREPTHPQPLATLSGTGGRHRSLKKDSPLTQHRMSASVSLSAIKEREGGHKKKGFDSGGGTGTTSLPHLRSISLAGP